jgi:ligand-binding sensor domain-containing protein
MFRKVSIKKVVIPMAFCISIISCKKEHTTSTIKNSKYNSTTTVKNTYPVISKVDTVFAENAPKRITRNIKTDKQGRLLIAGYDDIIFYDGNSFTKLNKPDNIESWYAFDVLEDRNGNIWIASDQSGAYRIDGKTGVVTNFNTKNGLGHTRNMCVYEDKDGNIWIGGQGGLSKYDGKSFKNFNTDDGLPHNDINTILEDSKGNIWFGTRGNAGMFNGDTFSELKKENGESFFNVWSILEDSTGVIWLVDNKGLWKYSNNTFSHQLDDIWKVYEDAKGSFWFTGMLNGGASSLNKIIQSDTSEKLTTEKVFTSGNMFFGLVEDPKGTIWIGGGDGIWKYNDNAVTYYSGVLRE